MMQQFSLLCFFALMVGASPVANKDRTEETDQTSAAQTGAVTGEARDSNCGACHSCATPTATMKCIRPCARGLGPEIDLTTPGSRGPDLVILDELEDAYLPVPFDHKGHADMADMAYGCITCHHYTPEGAQHPACKTCHDVDSAGTDIYKPGLKGAYHQQCLNCHREWIDEKDCDICHREKAGRSRGSGAAPAPSKDDILGLMHPPISQPTTETYAAGSNPEAESQVVFRHQEHVNRFGLKCVECHHEPSCARCHTREQKETTLRNLVEHHRPCLRCHKEDMNGASESARCDSCHWREGQPKIAPFDHASTGWPLGRFHESKSCRVCHKTVPFTELSTDCSTCHAAWSPSVFDHRVTGQVLDENHAAQDCEVCHVERRFDRPPRCDECHDEEEDGITFPAKRPGPTTASP